MQLLKFSLQKRLYRQNLQQRLFRTHMINNSVFPTDQAPAPAREIATRFCTENANSPDYEKIRELEMFNYYDQLWIRRSIDDRDKGKSNVPNCYEVTSRSGQPIFKVVQTLDNSPSSSESSTSKPPFKLSIFDMRSGNEVLKVVAKQGADSVVVYARQKHFQYHGIGKILRIRQGTMFKGPDYNVRGSNGKVVIKINGSYCLLYKKANFDVCTSDDSQCYGKIQKDREADESAYRTMDSPDALYKISFPLDISMVSKSLILATTLVLDYDYFDCGTKEVRSDLVVMSIGLAFVTIIVVMLIVILSVSVTNKLDYLGKSNSTRNELDNQFELIETTTSHIK